MRLVTLLPLGRVDPGLRTPEIPLDVWTVAENAELLEQLDYSGMVVEENKDNPFPLLTLATQHTERLRLTTDVAIGITDEDRQTLADLARFIQASDDIAAGAAIVDDRTAAGEFVPAEVEAVQ